MKPLFIPLKTEYFDAFKSGDKTDELRRYGPRWNEKTCTVGRPVVLSKGYSGERLHGTITAFGNRPSNMFQGLQRVALGHVFGFAAIDIAVISIELEATR